MPSSEFLDETVAFWSPKYGREITREEAREIIENMTGFFLLLHEWDEQDRRAQAQQNISTTWAPTNDLDGKADI